jgi:hypothetical protein
MVNQNSTGKLRTQPVIRENKEVVEAYQKKLAAEKLEQAQREDDRGELKPKEPGPEKLKSKRGKVKRGKKKRKIYGPQSRSGGVGVYPLGNKIKNW